MTPEITNIRDSGLEAPYAPSIGSAAFTAERELPTGLAMNRWARALCFRRHPSGAVCVGWQLYPAPVYVVGWSSWAGFKVLPKLRDGFVEPDPGKAEFLLDALCERIYAAGPTEAMIEAAEHVRAKYAANGARGGRGRKGGQVPKSDLATPPACTPPKTASKNWRESYPRWSFEMSDNGPWVMGPSLNGKRNPGANVKFICSHYGAEQYADKSLAWWEKHGPTAELMEAFYKFHPETD